MEFILVTTVLRSDESNSTKAICILQEPDYAILWQLEKGAIPSSRFFSEGTGLTQHQVRRRIKVLEQNNIVHTLALNNIEASGQNLAHYFIRVKNRAVREVANDVARLGSTVMIARLRSDYHLLATARTSEKYSPYRVLETLSGIPGISTVCTELVLRPIVNQMSHICFGGSQGAGFAKEFKSELATDIDESLMDDLDFSIVAHLQKTGWTSNRKIAKKCGVTEGAIRYRIGKLQEKNLLQFVTSFDPGVLGLKYWSWLRVNVHPEKLDGVIETLKESRWSKYLAVTTGQKSLTCLALTRGKRELEVIIDNKVRVLPGVNDISASQLVSNYKLDKRWGWFS